MGTQINMTTNASYNFKAPNIAADADKKIEVTFPTAEALTPTVGATTAVTINRQVTCINLGELGAATTVNLTIASHVQTGAIIHVTAKSDATARAVTFGTGFTSPTLAGTISKTKVRSFIYNGLTFLPLGTELQID